MKAAFTSLFLLIFGSGFAQPYIPLPVGNARWMEYYYDDAFFPQIVTKNYCMFSVDTATHQLYGRSCRKYEYSYDSVYNANNVFGTYMVFDDTINRKIYLVDSVSERLIYDFSKSVGDTIHFICANNYDPRTFIIDSIISNNVLGINRRHFYLTDSAFPGLKNILIEGIGSTLVFKYNLLSCKWVLYDTWLRCLQQNNMLLYQNAQSCSYIVGHEDFIKPNESIKIASNPVLNSEIEILNPTAEQIQWQLYSPEGFLLAKGNSLKIQVSQYTSGIFFLQIRSGKSSTVFKILKF